jgi:CheY-like chemotaxis protein
MAHSISNLVQQEQHARQEAEAANRTKDEFLATLSHELRTPLNAILGWASILSRSDYDKARVRHAVHVIERNARIQSQMIEELLDVSRIASGSVMLNASDVLVASVVDAAVESIRPAADAKNVTILKQIGAPDLMIHADGRRLQQVVWNLLSNAVRFTPAGGRVEVTLTLSDDQLELRVADSGCGIAPEFLPHVFERFRQGDSSTTRAHGGLGLGLAIVQDLVELHGGTVRAESLGEGMGATFIVRLPVTRGPRRIVRTAPAPMHGLRLAGSRVLVVDDDADSRDVLKAVLESAGAEVVTTESAEETRRLFAHAHPNLLIADIGMPEEDGYSLIASIREMESGISHVPAIALTARTRPEDVEQALAAGYQLHLAKPVDSRQLVESIASLVGPAV